VGDRVIDVRRLRKSYGGVERLYGISFSVERGEIFGFLGTNGAGKTTTIEILEGYRAREEAGDPPQEVTSGQMVGEDGRVAVAKVAAELLNGGGGWPATGGVHDNAAARSLAGRHRQRRDRSVGSYGVG